MQTAYMQWSCKIFTGLEEVLVSHTMGHMHKKQKIHTQSLAQGYWKILQLAKLVHNYKELIQHQKFPFYSNHRLLWPQHRFIAPNPNINIYANQSNMNIRMTSIFPINIYMVIGHEQLHWHQHQHLYLQPNDINIESI